MNCWGVNKMAEYIQVKCLEVNQPIGTFYVGTINWKDLLQISFADIRRLGNERSLDNYLGIQRELSPKRVEELKKYVNTVDAAFPTSVILAVESENAEFDSQKNILNILADKDVAKIIDGQHRIKGLEGFEGDKDFEVNVTIFVDMDIEDQAMVFATINLAQTKVNKSLVYDLYEYTKQRSPQKTCHNIVRILNSKEGSPFYKRIKILGSATPGLKQTITQATFVETLLRYVSGNSSRALDDRDILKREELPEPATDKDARKLIFRNMFLQKHDAEIAKIVWDYFDAVREHWPISWGEIDQPGNILPRTNGFRAFMRLLPEAYNSITDAEKSPNKREFFIFLKKIKIEDGTFISDKYKPGTSGESSLADELFSFMK